MPKLSHEQLVPVTTQTTRSSCPRTKENVRTKENSVDRKSDNWVRDIRQMKDRVSILSVYVPCITKVLTEPALWVVHKLRRLHRGGGRQKIGRRLFKGIADSAKTQNQFENVTGPGKINNNTEKTPKRQLFLVTYIIIMKITN